MPPQPATRLGVEVGGLVVASDMEVGRLRAVASQSRTGAVAGTFCTFRCGRRHRDSGRRPYTGSIGTLHRHRFVTIAALGVAAGLVVSAQARPAFAPGPSVEQAARFFYAGRYDDAASLALEIRPDPGQALASYEIRTSALHFRIKRELAGARDRKAALAACQPCGALLTDLTAEIAAGRALARERIKANARDDDARFFLGKIDLTHVWLHLETLGRRTGWGEYWEARRSLDDVLEHQPGHLRATVARAWINYIVDTRVPRGFRWMLGGGDRKGALLAARQAADSPGEPVAVIEARFALWEMLTREGRLDEAREVARVLYAEFPENKELERAAK